MKSLIFSNVFAGNVCRNKFRFYECIDPRFVEESFILIGVSGGLSVMIHLLISLENVS